MADVSKIKLPSGTTYNIKDDNALPLTGGSVTGPVSFGDSVSIDEATVGDLVVNGSASFTNGAHGVIDKAKAADVTSTLNALVKYEDTEGTFSDSNIYNTSNNLIIGSTSVPGNIQIGAKNDNYGILPNTNNYNQVGSSSLYWYRAYINNYYGLNSHVTNWDAGKNIGTASTSSAAATLGSVYFYNACAAGGTQTKTLLSNGSATSNITVTLPSATGTLALTSQIPDISGKADKATTLAGYGITDAKIASGVITLGSNTITPLTSSSTLSAAKLSGAIPSAVTATTQASTDNSTKIATTAYVTTAIANLPEPMVFKGSVGTGGTITSLPTAAASNEGHTYKVITALSSPSAKVGDTVISNGSSWVVIPSGDEPSGTVTSVAVSNGGGLSVSGSPVTSSGTITISHADTSSQASSSNSGRTYIQSLTLDTYGHVTGISTATETVTNTDTKLQVAEATSATQYYPLIGTGTTAATRQYDTTGFKYKGTTGTTSAVGSAVLELGNSTASGTAGNKQGQLIVYGTNAKKATITLAAPSADVALALPTSGGTLALASQIPSVPSVTGSSTTGITASTTATKTTLGTASSIYGVKSGTNSTTTASKASGSNGSASTWAFEEVSIPNVTAAGSASTWTFGSTTVGDGTLVGAVDSSDSSMLVITAGTKSVQQKTGGANGSAPTLGTAIKVQSKKSGSNGTAPSWSFTDVTVPIRNDSATSVPSVSVASATVSVTDPGHTHSI